uniref:Myb/SANT-like domain-containing protein n=1 Tax=Lactuca sativa TaxID=4236 RepID=A0A9R1UML9_LACSA|nr:hypothetical protein LSAT_V11C800404280 [Lactuca sativa]
MVIYYVNLFVGMAARSKHTQTTEEDAKLIEALLELHVVKQLLYVSLPNLGLKVEPHIKLRMKTWKNHFNIIHDMVYGTNTSGFGWDMDKCCVIADVEVWDGYIKSHKGATCFRDEPFPQFDNLCKIFGKDKDNGNGATYLGEDVIEETQRNSHVDVEVLEDIVEETQKMLVSIVNAIDIFNNVQFRTGSFFKMREEEKVCYMEIIGPDVMRTSISYR